MVTERRDQEAGNAVAVRGDEAPWIAVSRFDRISGIGKVLAIANLLKTGTIGRFVEPVDAARVSPNGGAMAGRAVICPVP